MDKKIIEKKSSPNGIEIEDYVFSVSEDESNKLERPLEKDRIRLFWWITVFVMIIFGARIFYLNVIKGDYYREIAKGNSIRSLVIKAPRGKIYDRSGTVLVNNIPSQDVVIIPGDLPREKTRLKEMIEDLSEILNLNEGDVLGKLSNLNKNSFRPVLFKENIPQDKALIIAERKNDFPGIVLESTAIREYVDGLIFSHVLGYEGKIEKDELEENPKYSLTDYIGKQGIEKSYEKQLKGIDGAVQVEVDSLGNIKKERGVINPQSGNDLVLSIDAKLQKKIFDNLLSTLEKTETRTAAAVAINPKNGEVLALVSLPAYDNNLFSRKISQEDYLGLINNPDNPMFNRAVSGAYPPGSTLKPLVAAAALSEGTIDEHTSVDCSGAIHVGSFRFGDWKTHGHVNTKSAIAHSCDVFFYSVGGGYGNISGLGMSKMKKYENDFGLGKTTGIDIPGEVTGFIPDEGWKLDKFGERWYIGNSYHAAIGQGFITTTPLQLANYTSAIANGGTLYQPRIVKQINSSKGSKDTASKVVNDSLAYSGAIKTVREGMRMTVTEGTASSLGSLPVEVAGKTGTAQFGSEEKTHNWFVSFAPYNDPEIAMVVLVEGEEEGSSSAVPVSREVYQWYFGENRE